MSWANRSGSTVTAAAGLPGPAARGVDEQAQRIYAAMATVFLDGNDFKVSAIYTHRQAVEDWALAARNADVVNDIDDDTWVLEATYRF